MAGIAADIGTTTSSICWINSDNTMQHLDFEQNGFTFFPSIVTYRDGDPVRIGYHARKMMHINGARSYKGREYKLKLGTGALIGTQKDRPPEEVMRDVIGYSIKQYMDFTGAGIPEQIVYTIPEDWKQKGMRMPAVAALQHIFDELGVVVRFESEPIAAASFYVYQNFNQENFTGIILVVDYGGGTLDFTLCRRNEMGELQVLFSCGYVGKKDSGCAGEAFDDIVLKNLSDKNNLMISQNQRRFNRWKNDFEQEKIANSAQSTALVHKYYNEKDRNKRKLLKNQRLFSVLDPETYEDYEITIGDFVDAFEKVNLPYLKKGMQEVFNFCRENRIDCTNQNQMRVFLSGGFSNLYCVEAEMRNLFGAKTDQEDLRFGSRAQFDRALAVVRGAALIANDKIRVIHPARKYPGKIDLCCYMPLAEGETMLTMISEKSNVRDFQEPVYLPYRIAVSDSKYGLKLFVSDKKGEKTIKLSISHLVQYVPSAKYFQLGLSLNQLEVPILHILFDTGKCLPVSLDQYLKR